MSNINYLNDEHFDDIQEVVSEYFVRLGSQKIAIRITLDSNGYYQMSTSHFYKGSDLASPVITSAANFKSEAEALMYSRKQIAGFYDPTDKNAVWIENEYY
ncbi:hypothetical protein [Lysinibacillus capsici]|uniref:hypothetical protein n=1 Tax=Lysinibacillus capsici TaxID=2115968 RepID=UPI0028A79DD6|nr:hypothetical protein [Lysinibacillus capsici]